MINLIQNQRTKEWLEARIGRITASRFGDAMATPDTLRYKRYRDDLIDERIGLINVEEWVEKPWFAHGKEMEPRAIAAYAFFIAGHYPDAEVIALPEFIKLDLPGIKAGCSPDVIVHVDGKMWGAEIKCRATAERQWKSINSGLESQYRPQVYGGMWVTGATRWDWINYCEDDRLEPRHRLSVVPMARDDDYIARIEQAVRRLDAEVEAQAQEIIAALEAERGAAP